MRGVRAHAHSSTCFKQRSTEAAPVSKPSSHTLPQPGNKDDGSLSIFKTVRHRALSIHTQQENLGAHKGRT